MKFPHLCLAIALSTAPAALAAPTVAKSPMAFPAAFFADAQPATALDMLRRVPGFALVEGDSDVRGLAGTSANVVIDGRRPASKGETVADLLARIPASSVERIELIRDGGSIDLDGHTVIANIVRRSEASVRGRIEGGATAYRDGTVAPSLAADASRRSGDRLLEASFALKRELNDDEGRGPRDRHAPDGSLTRRADYAERKAVTEAKASGARERSIGGGRLRTSLNLDRTRERADIVQTRIAPVPGLETDLELERSTTGEFGATYDRPAGHRTALEIVALQRLARVTASQVARDGGDTDATADRSRSGESILRIVARSARSPVLSLEAGSEAAYNVLDSRSLLTSDGIAVPLPNDQVRVAERRAETFGTATLAARTNLSIEAGLRVETSVLTQRGDTRLRRASTYPKPRLALNWTPAAADRVHLSVERKVGQLAFTDFASSASLGSGTVTAGNADLRPETSWLTEASFEHRFGKGAAVLTVRHYALSDVVDRIPITTAGTTYDAGGNIGHGTRDEATAELTLPLAGFGIPGGLLRADATYRHSHVIDPTTGRARAISKLVPFSGAAHFTQDVPDAHLRWGADLTLAESQHQFRFNEVRRDHEGLRLDLFGEFSPAPTWRLRVEADNLTSRTRHRTRDVYTGPRDTAPLRDTEDRRLKFGPYVSVSIRRAFG